MISYLTLISVERLNPEYTYLQEDDGSHHSTDAKEEAVQQLDLKKKLYLENGKGMLVPY